MVTVRDVRALAMSLPRTEDHLIRDQVKFRVGRIVYAAISPDETILGFSNRWYPAAMERAVSLKLSDDLEIRVVTAPFFVATKLEAFKGRGNGLKASSKAPATSTSYWAHERLVWCTMTPPHSCAPWMSLSVRQIRLYPLSLYRSFSEGIEAEPRRGAGWRSCERSSAASGSTIPCAWTDRWSISCKHCRLRDRSQHCGRSPGPRRFVHRSVRQR